MKNINNVPLIPQEEAHKRISEWPRYVHTDIIEGKPRNRQGGEAVILMVRLYNDSTIDQYTKVMTLHGIEETFYYISTEYGQSK